MKFFFPKYSAGLFIVLFGAMAATYSYQDILFEPPQSVHQWRQCDCLSLAMNYYQDDNPFFEPSVHNLCSDGKGKTVSDFPLIYYAVGHLWKLFGHQEFIYRGTVLLLFFIGLLALFKLSEQLLQDSILAAFVSLMLFTSPVLVYYGNNFLMNVPAFSLGLVALHLFFKFYQSDKDVFLFASMIVYALAGLFKTPALMSFVAICGVFVFELIGMSIKSNGKVFARPKLQALPILAVPVVMLFWYMYAHHYNSKNCAGIFLVGILPIWELTGAQIVEHWEAIRHHMKWDYFRNETGILLLVLLVFVLVAWRRTHKLLRVLVLLLSIGFGLFVLLFFQPLKDHDYYMVNLFLLMPMIFLAALSVVKGSWPSVYRSWIFRLVLFAFLIHNVDFARRRINGRYSEKSIYNQTYVRHLEALKRIRPYINEVGIKPNDPIVFLSDPSITISLYLMNQKGWTNYNIGSNPDALRKKVELGAKYLFIYNDEHLTRPEFREFFTDKVGQFETISIYKL